MPRRPEGRSSHTAKKATGRKVASSKARASSKAATKPGKQSAKAAAKSSKVSVGRKAEQDGVPSARRAGATKAPGKPAAGGRKRSRATGLGDERPTRSPRAGGKKPVKGGTAEVRPGAKPPRRSVRSSGPNGPPEPMRIARAMARSGLCSRREAERWIDEGRVSVNGKRLTSPAVEVGPKDLIKVDGVPMPTAEPVQLWRYHKPKGLVTTNSDPQGRTTVFESLPEDMPRVVSVGRLDFNTEGLLLLTNDGALSRHLELPSTGWLRRYRVRAWGDITQADLDRLKDGITVEGVRYGPIEATLDTIQASNVWLTIGLREGKNREVRKVLAHLGLEVNRLIRISYGPFQLAELKPGAVDSVRRRVLADQLGQRLAREIGLADAGEAEAGRRGGKTKRQRNDG